MNSLYLLTLYLTFMILYTCDSTIFLLCFLLSELKRLVSLVSPYIKCVWCLWWLVCPSLSYQLLLRFGQLCPSWMCHPNKFLAICEINFGISTRTSWWLHRLSGKRAFGIRVNWKAKLLWMSLKMFHFDNSQSGFTKHKIMYYRINTKFKQ